METWISDLLEHLDFELSQDLTETPAIFFDRQEVVLDTSWSDQLVEALRGSRLLTPMLVPAYFRSVWNVAEWRTFEERERMTGRAPLIFPILLRGSLYYPKVGHGAPICRCVTHLSNDASGQTQKLAREIASLIADGLRHVPPFRPDFSVVDPTSISLEEANYSRLPEL